MLQRRHGAAGLGGVRPGLRPERRVVAGRRRRRRAVRLVAGADPAGRRSGIKIAAQLTNGSRANVTSAETYVFTGLGGQQSALGLILPAYLDAGGPGQVQGVWNYALTALTDGKKVVPATTVYQAQSGGLLGDFLAMYTAPNGGVTNVGVRVLLQPARARSRA